METNILYEVLSVLCILVPILMIIIMERFIYQREPTLKEIEDYQAKLDKMSQSLWPDKIKKGPDALTEIKKERRQQKIFFSFNLAIIYLSALLIKRFVVPEDYHSLSISLIMSIVTLAFYIIFTSTKSNLQKITGLK